MENEFGTRLYAAMRRKGITLTQLGDAVGSHYNVVSGWVNGHRFPQFENLVKIARVLEVSLDDLCGVRMPPTKEANAQLRQIVYECADSTQDLYQDLKKLHRDVQTLRKWARKYGIVEEEDDESEN